MPIKDKEKRAKYMKEWTAKNKEKIAKWKEDNKDKISERTKKWRAKNIDKCKEYNRNDYENNKQKHKEKGIKYRQTAIGKKNIKISKWKAMGVKCDNFDMLYENYLSETHCDFCRVKFGTGGYHSNKCLDHDHDTGLFRNFLCHGCNLKRG